MVDLFGNLTLLQHSLDYHLRRHGLLASNIANAETPGYQPLDLSFQATLSRTVDLRGSDARHLGASEESRFSRGIFTDPSGTPGNDGNTVSLDREMAKLTANSIRYRSAAEMLGRRVAMLRYAVSDGQRH